MNREPALPVPFFLGSCLMSFEALSVLQSYESLKRFVRGDDHINQIRSTHCECNPDLVHVKPLPNLAFRWHVLNIVTAPFRYLFILFLKCFNAKSLIHKCRIGFDIYSESIAPINRTKIYLLQRTKNQPAPGTEEITKHPPVRMTQIWDQRIKANSTSGQIEFDHQAGNCKGDAQYFLHLYHQTKDAFSNPREHLSALGKVFENGSPKEAILLQGVDDGSFSQLSLDVAIDRTSDYGNVFTQINDLPPGSYFLKTAHHGTAYIKYTNELGYLFNDNLGVVEINGPDQGEKILNLLQSHLPLGYLDIFSINYGIEFYLAL